MPSPEGAGRQALLQIGLSIAAEPQSSLGALRETEQFMVLCFLCCGPQACDVGKLSTPHFNRKKKKQRSDQNL